MERRTDTDNIKTMFSTLPMTNLNIDLFIYLFGVLCPINSISVILPFTPQILILTHQQQRALENIVGKEEIACNKQFLLFPQCFLLNQIIVSLFVHIFDISLFAAESEKPKIGISGKGLMATVHKSMFPGQFLNRYLPIILTLAGQS